MTTSFGSLFEEYETQLRTFVQVLGYDLIARKAQQLRVEERRLTNAWRVLRQSKGQLPQV